MLPTLSQHGDCVLVSPLPYWSPLSEKHKSAGPKRGDVVVATSPMHPGQTVCKRVLGIEGDLIEIEPRRGGQRKWIDAGGNGYMVDIPDSQAEMDNVLLPRRNGEGQWVKVPKGHVWLVGDNLSNSTDSRKYGPVPIAMVKGKVIARVSQLDIVLFKMSGADVTKGLPQSYMDHKCCSRYTSGGLIIRKH